jgi:hypothetical protein
VKIPDTLPWEWDGPVWNYDPENEAPWIVGQPNGKSILTGEIKCASKEDAEYLVQAANLLPEFVVALEDMVKASHSKKFSDWTAASAKARELLNKVKS